MTEAHVTVIDFHTLSPLNSPASTSLHWLLHCFAHVWCHICPFQSVVPDCRLHTGGIITASSYIKSLLPRSVDWNHQLWLSTFSWMNDPHIHGFPSGTPATGRSDTWSLVNEHYSDEEFIKLSGSTFETSKRLKCLLLFLLITHYDIHQEYQQVLQYQEDNAFNNLTDLLFTCLKNSKVQLLNIYLFAERFIPFSLNWENNCRKLDFSPRQIREAECVWWTPTCLSVFNELKDLYRNGFVIIINKGVFSNTLLYRNLYLPIICVN